MLNDHPIHHFKDHYPQDKRKKFGPILYKVYSGIKMMIPAWSLALKISQKRFGCPFSFD